LIDTTYSNSRIEPAPRAPASEATPWDGVDGQIKSLAQQAMVTQTTIGQLQARPEADPLPAIGILTALVAILALTGWYTVKRLTAGRLQNTSNYSETLAQVSVIDTLHEPLPTPAAAPRDGMAHEASESLSPKLSDPDAFMALALDSKRMDIEV
jgi:hypothetical protein